MDDPDEARAYAETDFSSENSAFVARLLELAVDEESPRALDLGTGPGEIAVRIAAARPQWRVCGVDASAAMLRFARREQTAQHVAADWVLTDVKASPFPDGAFDLVFSNSILHHIADTETFWREVKRLARPGALLFFRDLFRPPNPETAWALVHLHAARSSALLKEEFYRSFLSAHTPDEIRAQLERAGLDTLNVRVVTDRHVDIFGRR
jgi:ubiquinone/menaquinone biosynthesis C-methylase UbiE